MKKILQCTIFSFLTLILVANFAEAQTKKSGFKLLNNNSTIKEEISANTTVPNSDQPRTPADDKNTIPNSDNTSPEKEKNDNPAESNSQSLADRKTKAESDLAKIKEDFDTLIVRTQATINRLSTKGVVTDKSQASLLLATQSQEKAKVDLKNLISLSVNEAGDISLKNKEGAKQQTAKVTEIKNAFKKVQDDLKNTRSLLIESLTELKASVAVTLSEN